MRAAVGDRYVLEQLVERNWMLGGESSGHIVCRNLMPTGDGTISAVQVLMAMVESGKTLAELKSGMHKAPQTMINVRMNKRVDIRGIEELNAAVAATEAVLGDEGRVLLRPSGTEPVVRVMVEGQDAAQVQTLCEELADNAEKILAKLVK